MTDFAFSMEAAHISLASRDDGWTLNSVVPMAPVPLIDGTAFRGYIVLLERTEQPNIVTGYDLVAWNGQKYNVMNCDHMAVCLAK